MVGFVLLKNLISKKRFILIKEIYPKECTHILMTVSLSKTKWFLKTTLYNKSIMTKMLTPSILLLTKKKNNKIKNKIKINNNK